MVRPVVTLTDSYPVIAVSQGHYVSEFRNRTLDPESPYGQPAGNSEPGGFRCPLSPERDLLLVF